MKTDAIEPREAVASADVGAGLPSEIRWRVPAALPYFAGHFPEMPIMPAVAMIDAAVAFAERATGLRWQLREVTQAKFTRPVGPGDEVHVELRPTDGESGDGASIFVRWSLAATAERLAEWTMRLEREFTEGAP